MKAFLFGLAALALALTVAVAGDPPKVGDVAPVFAATDLDGHAWRLADHLGREAVIVYFYPADGTPGCTKEACGFRDRLDTLKKSGVAIVGISRDTAESHQKFRANQHLNFPLLVDTDGKVAELYGASAPNRPRDRRVSFLIGRDGKILHVTDNRDATVHLTELIDAIAQIKS